MSELAIWLLIGVPCLLWIAFVVWLSLDSKPRNTGYVQRDATHRASWTTSAMQNEMENGQ